MERLILKRLLEWKNSPYRKPLILKGVRQVGKTWILKEFGRRYYDNTAYFNFDEHEEYKQFFETTKDVDRLLQNLMLASGQKITPEKTLIIFDEVQDCPKVINSMKYFCENAPQYHIACAGSLLGIALAKPSSFPVGKVNFMQIDPMTFTEFLQANGDENVLSYCIPRKVDCKPSNRQVKVLCEVASRICPWYISDDAAMLRTLDALGLTLNLNEDASKVETTPYSNVLGRTAILGAFLPTKGAAILVLLIRPRLYPEVLHTSSIGIIFSGLDHCVLDIQQILD